MAAVTLEPSTTALVLIDLQKGIVGGATVPHAAADVVARARQLVDRCRAAGATVIFVRVDPGPDGLLFPRVTADKPRPPSSPGPDFAELAPALGVVPNDIVVTKHQPNAFYGTDLEIQLVRRGIRTIILGGIATNLGVESTARAANERGYEQLFVEDVMAARELDLHTHSVTRILPTMGRVRRMDEVVLGTASA